MVPGGEWKPHPNQTSSSLSGLQSSKLCPGNHGSIAPNSDNHGFAELLAEKRGGGDQRGGEKSRFDHYGSVEICALPVSLQR